MLRNDLIPDGMELVAFALLSQGRMTAPRAVVVTREKNVGPTGEHTVHEVNLSGRKPGGTAFFFNGSYGLREATAMEEFSRRVSNDVTHYLGKNVPLTDPAHGREQRSVELLGGNLKITEV